MEECPFCDGTGNCPDCMDGDPDCPTCTGSGVCDECGGIGEIETDDEPTG